MQKMKMDTQHTKIYCIEQSSIKKEVYNSFNAGTAKQSITVCQGTRKTTKKQTSSQEKDRNNKDENRNKDDTEKIQKITKTKSWFFDGEWHKARQRQKEQKGEPRSKAMRPQPTDFQQRP